jgi:hypothetical protein
MGLRKCYPDKYTVQVRYSFSGGKYLLICAYSIHDAFQDWQYWQNFMTYPGWNNVALDTHCEAL